MGSHFSYVAFVLREVWARLFIAHYLKVNVQPSPFSCCVCFSTDCSIFGRQMHFSDWVSDGPDVHRRGISVCPRHGWGSRGRSELCGFRGLRWMGASVDGYTGGWRHCRLALAVSKLCVTLFHLGLGKIFAFLFRCSRCQLVVFHLSELEIRLKIRSIF